MTAPDSLQAPKNTNLRCAKCKTSTSRAILKQWLKESPLAGSTVVASTEGRSGDSRVRGREGPERQRQDSTHQARSAIPLLYPTFQPSLLETLTDKMENGNQAIRAALLLLAIVVLFGSFLIFPLLAGAIGEASLRWLYSPTGVLMMMTAASLWLVVACGNFMAVRDELQVHHKRAPKGFPATSSEEAWARVEIAISGTVKIKQFPAQNLALACYWFEKDRSHWWRLPPATLMKKTSVALDAAFDD